MEDIIKQIIEIDKKARSLVRDAKAAQNELDGRIENDITKMTSDIETRTIKRNENLSAAENDKTEKKINEINAESEKSIAKLEEKYRLHKEEWADKIVSGVTGA